MRLLLAHNQYKIRGGEDEVFDSELALLRSQGHEVFTYLKSNDAIGPGLNLALGIQSSWNGRVYAEIKELVTKHKIDLMHCHNLYPQLSPAVFHAAKAGGAATVQTLHNYKIACPAGQFFRNGSVCELCSGKSLAWRGILYKCYRNSRAATGALAVATASHRLLNTWNEKVDVYISLTEFARNKYINAGLPCDRIVVKPNFVHDPGVGEGKGNFVLFVGRLSDAKGISLLLRGWRREPQTLHLKIVGAGHLEEAVRTAAANDPTIEYLGVQPLSAVLDLLGEARALMFPSQWYEAMPRTIIEAFAKGTPVIGSYLGAMCSLIQHQFTGLHFPVGDEVAMMTQLEWLVAHEHQYRKMRTNCRATFQANFCAAKNGEMLTEIYSQALRRNQRDVLAASKKRRPWSKRRRTLFSTSNNS